MMMRGVFGLYCRGRAGRVGGCACWCTLADAMLEIASLKVARVSAVWAVAAIRSVPYVTRAKTNVRTEEIWRPELTAAREHCLAGCPRQARRAL